MLPVATRASGHGFPSDSPPGRAALFAGAAFARVAQQRCRAGEPIFARSLAVVRLLLIVTDDDATLATGFLFDSVARAGVSLLDVDRHFGADIAMLVQSVTEVFSSAEANCWCFDERKRSLAASVDRRAKTVLLAALFHSVKAFARAPALEPCCRAEMASLLELLGDGDPILLSLARKALEAAYAEVEAA